MKKIIVNLVVMFMVFASFTHAQSPFLTYKLANPMILSGTPDTLSFDVQVKCDVPGTYHTDLYVYINYNEDAFGESVVANNKIIVMRGDLIDEEAFPDNYKYTLFPLVDNSFNRFALATEPAFGPGFLGFLTQVPTTFTTYAKIKLAISDEAELAGLNFQESLMNGNQFYLTVPNTMIAYGTCVFENNFNTLPLNPNTSLLFSEIGDPSDLTSDSFIEIYNAGATTVDFTNHYAWYLSINSSTSTILTGTLAPGATYIFDITGTSGTSDFLLSTYGDYINGTPIDVYDGSLPGFDFTGKQAVRHYNIVSPNLTPALSEWVIRTANDMDMTAGSHRTTLNWAGVNAEWHSNANWAGSFIPDAGHNVAINAGITPVISNGDNAYAHNLAIGSAGLIIESLPGADGSLITYGAVSGTASVERFLGADRYWYVTQPVTSATANVFLHTWMFTYNAGAWSAYIEDENTPLSVMKGYAVWTSSVNKYDEGLPPLGDTTTAYNGILNTGDISTGLTSGFNFVGNPYPSAADWNAASGWTRVNLATNTYYVWTGTTYASYIVGGPGTNGGTQYIPAAQGFFVNASAVGSLGVSNEVRTHNTQDFWKSDENRMNLLSLTVSYGNVNDETVIYFNEEATQELDYSFDALKLMAEAAPQAYTLMGTEKMSINTFNSVNETNKVIMGINAPEAGDYTITASNLESFDASIPVYLEDVVTGQKTDLREISTYAFNSGEGMSERFVVHFAEYAGLGDNAASEVNSIYAADQKVYVDFNANKGEIAIYNILGMEISRTSASNGLNMISVPQGNAVYIVKVISDNTTVTKKVFVK